MIIDHGKLLGLGADTLRFAGGRPMGIQQAVLGPDSLLMQTGGMLRVLGAGGILLRAPEITVRTPLEINNLKSREHAVMYESRMGAKGSRNPATGGDASFSMQYEFNGLAGKGILRGTVFEKYKAFEDAPDYEAGYSIGVKIAAGSIIALLVGVAVGAAVIGLSAMQLAVCAGAVTAVAGIAATVATAVRDDGNTHIKEYTGSAWEASVRIGGAIIQFFLVPRGSELLAYRATGGLPIPFMGRVITMEQIYAPFQIAGWGFSVRRTSNAHARGHFAKKF